MSPNRRVLHRPLGYDHLVEKPPERMPALRWVIDFELAQDIEARKASSQALAVES